jgi:hypothetical protein
MCRGEEATGIILYKFESKPEAKSVHRIEIEGEKELLFHNLVLVSDRGGVYIDRASKPSHQ